MREKSLFVPIESPQLYSALFNPFLGHFSRGSIIGSFYTQSLEVICSISRSGELSFAVNSFSNAFWAGFCSLFVQQPALFCSLFVQQNALLLRPSDPGLQRASRPCAARLNCKKVRALNALISPRRPEAPVQRGKGRRGSLAERFNCK
jgi:hypothetical protein